MQQAFVHQFTLSQLIGRKHDLDALVGLITNPEVRLVTICGVGGIGKTRLALQLIDEVSHDFADGIYFVDLAPIRSVSLLPEKILTTIGIEAPDPEDARAAIGDFLESKDVLLILDNMEHLLQGASIVEDLLLRSPGLAIVATSRERLGIPAEHVLNLGPLAVPDQHKSESIEIIEGSEAVQLFLSRARAAEHGFTLTTESASDVASICRRLDGLPLAIELAASRIADIPPHLILRNFVRILPFLERSNNDPNARHRTMGNAIAWSIDLLSDDERLLFARLSVFGGTFGMDAARAISLAPKDRPVAENTQKFDDTELMRQLGSLVSKHLLYRHDWNDAEPQYGMLQIIREYGRELLNVSDEWQLTNNAHADYFSSLAEEYRPHLLGPDPTVWIKRYERDLNEFRASLDWYLKHRNRDGLAAVMLCNRLAHFWLWRGHFQEATDWYTRSIAQTSQGYSEAIAVAYMQLGHFTNDDVSKAAEYYQRSLEIYQHLNHKQGIANLLTCLAMTSEESGEYDHAENYLHESMRRYKEIGNDHGTAQCLYQLGMIIAIRGDYEEANRHLDSARSLYEQLGDTAGTVYSISEMGHLYRLKEQNQKAKKLLQWSLKRFQDASIYNGLCFAHYELGLIELAEGNSHAAITHFKTALELLLNSDSAGPRLGKLVAGMALAAVSNGMPDRGVEFLSSIERWSITSEYQWSLDEQAILDSAKTIAQANLSDADYTTAWTQGTLYSIEGISRLALETNLPEPEFAPVASAPAEINDGYKLTERQRKILCMIVRGETNRRIAEQLFISERTVAVHVQNILRKMDADNRTHASSLAFHAGLCPTG